MDWLGVPDPDPTGPVRGVRSFLGLSPGGMERWMDSVLSYRGPLSSRGGMYGVESGAERATGTSPEEMLDMALLAAGFTEPAGTMMDLWDIGSGAWKMATGQEGGAAQAAFGTGGLLMAGVAGRNLREGMETVRHYGRGANESVLDPQKMGTGKPGAERARPDRPPATHVYDPNRGPERQFRRLPFVEVDIPREGMLRDPEEIRAYYQRAVEEVGPGEAAATRMEELIRDDYIGYWDTQRGIGKVFVEVPTGVTDVDRAIARSHREGGGATFDPRTGEDLAFGDRDLWAVATPHQAVQKEPLEAADVARFRHSMGSLFEDPRMAVGSWWDRNREIHGGSEMAATATYRTKDAAVRNASIQGEAEILNLRDLEPYAPVAQERAHWRAKEGVRTKANRAETIRELEAGMTEEELDWFQNAYANHRANTIDSYLRAPTPRAWASAALRGAQARGWYEASRQGIQEAFGDDAPRFAALLAATSPNKSVRENVRIALETWRNWVGAGRPTDADEIRRLTTAQMDSDLGNTVRALQADPEALVRGDRILSGPKVHPFFRNLMGLSDVTLDTHMARAAGTMPKRLDAQHRNVALKALTRNAARELEELLGAPVTEQEVQEMVWAYARGLTEASSNKSTADVLEEVMKNPDMLLAGGKTLDDRILDSDPIGTLLGDPEFQELAVEAGARAPQRRVPAGMENVPEELIRGMDLRDIAQRIQAARTEQPLFQLLLGAGAAGTARGLLDQQEDREWEPGTGSLLFR